MIHILIADDHAIVRSGLVQIMATTNDIVVAGETANGAQTLDLVRNNKYDLLLLDMDMPGIGSVELIRLLQAENKNLPILVLSMHNEGQIIRRALSAGAAGFVTKASDPKILLVAIRMVAGGGKFIDPMLVDAAVFETDDPGLQPDEMLSERERQILRMIVAGKPIGDIADQLHLSPKTVSTHKMRLMKKLNIDNNADLVRFASRQGWSSE